MRKGLLLGLAAMVVAAFAGLGLASPASASPARSLSLGNQACHANGTVSMKLFWTPSGAGQQWVDLAVDPNFNQRSTGGPYAANQGEVEFRELKLGATYYARVWTYTGQWHASSALKFTVAPCTPSPSPTPPPGPAPIGAPTGLSATSVLRTTANIGWTPGQSNIWFCVDTARSVNELLTLSGSWRNHHCGTTSNLVTVTGLNCGTQYFYLVYSWNARANIKSAPASFTTQPCAAITPPYNLYSTNVTQNSARIGWTPGQENAWFCVDTAKSVGDLLNLSGSWRNHHCGTTSNLVTVSGLDCGTQYFYLVYSWNSRANIKSAPSSFQTAACSTRTEAAPIDGLDVQRVSGNYRAFIEAGLPNACHSPGGYNVHRVGVTVFISVWNDVTPAAACAQVYGTYDLNINLGSDFTSGVRYYVVVNNQVSESFVAQ